MHLELTFAALLLQASPPAQATAPPVTQEQGTPAPQTKENPSSLKTAAEQAMTRHF